MSSQSARYPIRRTVLSGALLVALMAGMGIDDASAAGATSGQEAQSNDSVRSFDIPRQPAGAGLNRLAEQADITLVFSSELVSGAITNPVKGNYSISDALRLMLEGTSLSWQQVNDATVAISRKSDAPAYSNESITNQIQRTQATESEGTVPNQQGEAPQEVPATSSETTEMDPIIVIGSYIRGATPASPVLTVTREDIDRSGYSTIGDVIRRLPQSFSGGQNPGVTGALGAFNSNNFGDAASVDLRGLGPGATLTLVNGHRLAYNGIYNATDISAIPLAAVDRVEIMTDGGSALYGSDAIGGVVNFILRRNYDGAETRTRGGDSTQGGGSEVQFNQLAGRAWEGGSALINYEYYAQQELRSNEREVSAALPSPNTLLPEQERSSVFVSFNQALSPTLDAFVEGLYTKRRTEKTLTIFGFTSSNRADITQYGGTGGIRAQLPADWRGELSLTRATDDERFTQVSLGPPMIFDIRNDLTAIDGLAEGSLFDLPAGELAVALGAGFRREKLDALYQTEQGGEREIKYLFTELNVPLLGGEGGPILEASLSGRYEDYSDFGSTFNSKIGLVYRASDDLKLRATWGESFRAPPLLQIDGTRSLIAYPALGLAIPEASPTATALLLGGANQNLRPETSESWTVGFDYAPDWTRGLDIHATYYEINYRDRIVLPLPTIVGIYDNPAFQPFIVKNPDASTVDSVIAEADDFLSLVGPFDPVSVMAIYLTRYHNAQSQIARGVDLGVSQRWDTQAGRTLRYHRRCVGQPGRPARLSLRRL